MKKYNVWYELNIKGRKYEKYTLVSANNESHAKQQVWDRLTAQGKSFMIFKVEESEAFGIL